MKFEGSLPITKKTSLSKYDNGHWQFDCQMGTGVGFIYLIRDRVLDRYYLGKKLFRGFGKLNKGQESNWRKYKSSSKLLAEVFLVRPHEEFDFICLEQYNTKGTLSYAETWTLCLVEAPTSVKWYNNLIEKVSWPVKEPISDKHKERLKLALSGHIFKEH